MQSPNRIQRQKVSNEGQILQNDDLGRVLVNGILPSLPSLESKAVYMNWKEKSQEFVFTVLSCEGEPLLCKDIRTES